MLISCGGGSRTFHDHGVLEGILSASSGLEIVSVYDGRPRRVWQMAEHGEPLCRHDRASMEAGLGQEYELFSIAMALKRK
jgi:hypothetical protein